MGQIGSAMTNPNTSAPNPSGFSGSEWAARFLGAGAKGAGQGLQNMGQQQRPQPIPDTPVPMPQQPQVNFPTQGVQMGPGIGPQKANNPFFYGYGQ